MKYGLAFLIMVIGTLILGYKTIKRSDEWIGDIYESHYDKDPFTTHFAIYGFMYWTAAATFIGFLAFVESLYTAAHQSLWYLVGSFLYWIGTKVFYEWTSMIYRCAKKREENLQKYLSE